MNERIVSFCHSNDGTMNKQDRQVSLSVGEEEDIGIIIKEEHDNVVISGIFCDNHGKNLAGKEAGLQIGDVIWKVNGVAIRSNYHAFQEIQSARKGKKIVLSIKSKHDPVANFIKCQLKDSFAPV